MSIIVKSVIERNVFQPLKIYVVYLRERQIARRRLWSIFRPYTLGFRR